MSAKTSNLKLNVRYSDQETFRNVLTGTDENNEIIDTLFPSLIEALVKTNVEFAKSVDLEEGEE